MEHTTNYQLSQWETTDRILMADFNADNAKIDAALAAHDAALASKADAIDLAALEVEVEDLDQRAGARLLATLTASTSGTSCQFSMDGVDWTAWREIHFVIDPYTDSGAVVTAYVNGSSSEVLGRAVGNPTADRAQHRYLGHVLLYPMFDPRHKMTTWDLYNGEFHETSSPFSELAYVRLAVPSGHTLYAGTVLEIWGAK